MDSLHVPDSTPLPRLLPQSNVTPPSHHSRRRRNTRPTNRLPRLDRRRDRIRLHLRRKHPRRPKDASWKTSEVSVPVRVVVRRGAIGEEGETDRGRGGAVDGEDVFEERRADLRGVSQRSGEGGNDARPRRFGKSRRRRGRRRRLGRSRRCRCFRTRRG